MNISELEEEKNEFIEMCIKDVVVSLENNISNMI
jgi:hypothetical protein